MTVDIAAWQALGSRRIATNGIELRVVDHGEGPVVVLCHGFPELAFSWRHQVFALAEAGYRVIAPDMRGYGDSSRPSEIEDYDVLTICADLVGLLNALGVDDAVFIGHDWGAAVVWQMALAYPGRVRAVAGLSVPPAPRAPVPPLRILRSRLGDSFYMCWFQEPGVADAVLAQDVRWTLLNNDTPSPQALARRPSGELPRPPWLSEDELQVFVDAFERTGFSGGLNYYRNMDRNWELTAPLDGHVITRPSFFLTGSEDAVRMFMPAETMTSVLADLRENIVIAGAGHWIQQERPAEVNEALVKFLDSI
ncbi:alpha/beta fold hydrolase [Nocardia beijingensis]